MIVRVEKGTPNDLDYKTFLKRSNFNILISTFALTLLGAYVTFVTNYARTMSRISYAHGIVFNIFILLLPCMSIVLNSWCTLVSARCAVLCSDPKIIAMKKYRAEYFEEHLAVCQNLNLHGILLFALSAGGSVFFCFEDYVYPLFICGFSFFVFVLIFAGKYRSLSELLITWDGIRAFQIFKK
ncbi:hypothetical protein JOM56_011886 [Amanita muscaria]